MRDMVGKLDPVPLGAHERQVGQIEPAVDRVHGQHALASDLRGLEARDKRLSLRPAPWRARRHTGASATTAPPAPCSLRLARVTARLMPPRVSK